MPTYEYRCSDGHLTQNVASYKHYQPSVPCGTCELTAERVFTVPIMVKAAPDVHYASPITGEPIRSHAARREDMAKHGAVEYDPEMKTDYERRREESMQQFEAGIDQTVAEEIAKLPSDAKAKLAREVIEGGLTTEAVRQTA